MDNSGIFFFLIKFDLGRFSWSDCSKKAREVEKEYLNIKIIVVKLTFPVLG